MALLALFKVDLAIDLLEDDVCATLWTYAPNFMQTAPPVRNTKHLIFFRMDTGFACGAQQFSEYPL